jgi:hypothetical protein
LNRTRLILAFCCPLFGLSADLSRADELWSLSPFAPLECAQQDWQPGGFVLPTLDATEQPGVIHRGQAPGASPWARFTQGTKNFFSRTYDVLTPWETENEKARARRQAVNHRSSGKKPQPSFWSGWFGGQEEPPQPRTVSEWLAQPRPN